MPAVERVGCHPAHDYARRVLAGRRSASGRYPSRVERQLGVGGFIRWYKTSDGRQPTAGKEIFVPCTFSLTADYVLRSRYTEARSLFERLPAITNGWDLSEEYNVGANRLLGEVSAGFFARVAHQHCAESSARQRSGRGPQTSEGVQWAQPGEVSSTLPITGTTMRLPSSWSTDRVPSCSQRRSRLPAWWIDRNEPNLSNSGLEYDLERLGYVDGCVEPHAPCSYGMGGPDRVRRE